MKNVPFKRFLVNRNGGMWGSEPGSDEFDVLCIRVADFDYENLKTKASASTVRSITEKQLQKINCTTETSCLKNQAAEKKHL